MTAVMAASQDSVASSTPSLTASASTASSSNDSSYNNGVPIAAARRKSSNGSGGSSTDVTTSSSSTGTPHDPNLKPSTSILANAHEGQSREKIRAKSSKRSAFKAAFIPVQPGRQMKTNGKPLGRTFERKTPLPQGAKFEGGPVLQHDPRGEEASAGDGLVPPSSTSPSKGGSIDAVSMSGDTDLDSLSQSTGSTTNLSSSPSNSTTDSSMSRSAAGDDVQDEDGEDDVFSEISSPLHPRSRTNTMSTESSSSVSSRRGAYMRLRARLLTAYPSSRTRQGSSTHASIRFAPLPVSGRLKRANSITIGVAARSQLLRSQGPGRNSSQFPAQPVQAPLPHGMSYQDTHKGVAAGSGSPRDAKAGAGGVQRSGSSSSRRSGAGEVGSPSSQSSSVDRMAMAGYYGGSVPDDTVDLGEELSKGLKSAWRKMRGSSGASGNAQDKAAAANAAKDGAGGASKDKVTPSTVPATKKQSGFDAPSTTSSTTSGAGAGQTAAAADLGGTPSAGAAPGDHTPRRPSSPAQGLSALSLQDRQQKQAQDSRHGNGSHRDHFPSHEGGTTVPTKSSSGGNTPASHGHGAGQWHHQNPFLVDHEDRGGDGAKTPRASQQYSSAHQNAANNPPRRLSTGAFLKNESLREMQERRRMGLLGGEGADEDEDWQGEEEEGGAAAAGKGEQNQAEQESLASSLLSRFSPWGASGNAPAPASGGSGVVKPAHNPEKEEEDSEGGRNSDDEEDDGDDEEMREAEQLAEQSAAGASRSRMEKAAAVEKVH